MSITLHYFDAYGRGETIRLILNGHGIEFTDDRLSGAAAGAFLTSGVSETAKVPALEIDGKVLVESRAIERYLLARAGIAPATPFEGYLNDSTIGILDDIRQVIAKFIYIDKDPAGLQEWLKTKFAGVIAVLNNRVNEHHLFVSNIPQHADWAVFEFLWDGFFRAGRAAEGRPLIEATAPKLVAFVENFKSTNQKLSDYLDARPELDR